MDYQYLSFSQSQCAQTLLLTTQNTSINMILIKRLHASHSLLPVLCTLLNCEAPGLWLGFIYVAMDMWLSPLFSSITPVAFSCSISVLESAILFPDPELSLTSPDGVGFPSDLFGALGFLAPNIVDPTRTLVDPSSICKKKW